MVHPARGPLRRLQIAAWFVLDLQAIGLCGLSPHCPRTGTAETNPQQAGITEEPPGEDDEV
jgi:hypothetical protein